MLVGVDKEMMLKESNTVEANNVKADRTVSLGLARHLLTSWCVNICYRCACQVIPFRETIFQLCQLLIY